MWTDLIGITELAAYFPVVEDRAGAYCGTDEVDQRRVRSWRVIEVVFLKMSLAMTHAIRTGDRNTGAASGRFRQVPPRTGRPNRRRRTSANRQRR